MKKRDSSWIPDGDGITSGGFGSIDEAWEEISQDGIRREPSTV